MYGRSLLTNIESVYNIQNCSVQIEQDIEECADHLLLGDKR